MIHIMVINTGSLKSSGVPINLRVKIIDYMVTSIGDKKLENVPVNSSGGKK